jgi:uncharacterized repeat protein (TIGR04076 family)
MTVVSYEEEVGPDVIVKVVSQEGYCGAGYNVGDEIRFCGLSVEGKVCIHALGTLLPTIKTLKFGGSFPWRDDLNTAGAACPDAGNPVVFEITRIPGQVSKGKDEY